MKLLNVPRDTKAQRAFAASLSRTPARWDCAAGMHEPEYVSHDEWHLSAHLVGAFWRCCGCHTPLANLRAR